MPSTFGQGFSAGAPSAAFKPGAAQPTPASGRGTQYQAYSSAPPSKASKPEPGTAAYYKSQNWLNYVSGMGAAGSDPAYAVGDYQRANAQGLANKEWASAIQTGFAGKAGAGYDTRYTDEGMWNQASDAEKNYYLNYGVRTGPPRKPHVSFDPRSLSKFGGRAFDPTPRAKTPMYQA